MADSLLALRFGSDELPVLLLVSSRDLLSVRRRVRGRGLGLEVFELRSVEFVLFIIFNLDRFGGDLKFIRISRYLRDDSRNDDRMFASELYRETPSIPK